jgi:hypothetical protein
MRGFMCLASVIAVLSLVGTASAQQPIAYPENGQSAQQQSKDDGECYVWAKQNTGIDPAAVAQAPQPPQQAIVGSGQRTRGAVRGALGGAAIGAIAGDTSKGAGVGAVVGTMAGGRQVRSDQAASQQQAQAQQQQKIDTFYRAYGACMEGRSYTIK